MIVSYQQLLGGKARLNRERTHLPDTTAKGRLVNSSPVRHCEVYTKDQAQRSGGEVVMPSQAQQRYNAEEEQNSGP